MSPEDLRRKTKEVIDLLCKGANRIKYKVKETFLMKKPFQNQSNGFNKVHLILFDFMSVLH